MRVVSFGDLALDVVVRLGQPLALGADATSSISLSPGGQGANVAAWVAALGGEAAWLGKRGADDAGALVAGRLEAIGVTLVGPIAEAGTGIIVSLVGPDGERSMCPDRGVATTLRSDELREEMLDCDHLHVSAYAMLAEPVGDAARTAIGFARGCGARVSVDLSSWSAIRDAGAATVRELLGEVGPDVIFANTAEEEIIGGPLPGVTWIRKRGADGCDFDGEHRAAIAVKAVIDTTGAGDALAAGWILGGPELALEAAARCVQQIGAVPTG